MKQTVSVVYVVNGTTKSDSYTCETSSIHLTGVYADSGTVVTLNGGDSWRKREVFYRHAEVIERLETGDEEMK